MQRRPAYIYQSPIILVGGGHMSWRSFDEINPAGFPVIAVDAGAELLRARDIQPDLILGDMDSIVRDTAHTPPIEMMEIDEQETTDFEKALYSLEAPLYLAFGFWGKRLDHSLAVLHALTKYRSHRQVVLIDEIDLLYIPRGPVTLPCTFGTRVSIIPLKPVSFTSSQGLKYPLDGLRLEMGSAIGVSNETTDENFSISPAASEQDNYGVVVPAENLGRILQHLTPQDI